MGAQEEPFRFGVVMNPDDEHWLKTVHRIEDLGYISLLMPEGPRVLSPMLSLATAAAVSDLSVGTYVLAAPMRAPKATAWEAHSLSVLTNGRFELGLGTGRRDSQELAERLGMPAGTRAQRLAQVEETIDHLRELDGEQHTRVMIAAGGPNSRTLAAAKADTVALPVPPLAKRAEVTAMVDDLREKAGDRVDEIELAMHLFVVGDRWPTWIKQSIGVDAPTLIAFDSLCILRGSPRAMADELLRRREAFGVTYLTVPALFCEALAPVIEILYSE